MRIERLILAEVKQGTTLFALDLAKANCVINKVNPAKTRVKIPNIMVRERLGMAVILLETVWNAINVPAVDRKSVV